MFIISDPDSIKFYLLKRDSINKTIGTIKISIKINKLKKGLPSNTEVYQKDSKEYISIRKSKKVKNWKIETILLFIQERIIIN